MASVAYSRTDQCVFIAQKRNSCVFSLLGNNTEYPFSASVPGISSREGHEWLNITLTPSQSPNAASSLINLTSSSLLSHRLWMPNRVYVCFKCLIIVLFLLHCT